MRTGGGIVLAGLLAVWGVGCGDDSSSGTDAGVRMDGGGATDSGGRDAVTPPADGGGDAAAPVPNDYACLGSVVWPVPMGAMVTFYGKAMDAISMAPLEGVTVRVCARADTDCAMPIGTTMTGADGMAHMDVPTGTAGFDGYFELTKTGYLDEIVAIVKPLTTSNTAETAGTAVMVTDAAAGLLATTAGVRMRDPARGYAAAAFFDCMDNYAAGVTMTVSSADAMTTIAYIGEGGVIDMAATATTSVGGAVAFNVPPGPATVMGMVVEGSRHLGAIDTIVRAGWITALIVPPTP